MNTMKRDDMLKEKHQLTYTMGMKAIRLLSPIVELFSCVGRCMFLDEEIKKSQPKEKTDAEVLEEKSPE